MLNFYFWQKIFRKNFFSENNKKKKTIEHFKSQIWFIMFPFRQFASFLHLSICHSIYDLSHTVSSRTPTWYFLEMAKMYFFGLNHAQLGNPWAVPNSWYGVWRSCLNEKRELKVKQGRKDKYWLIFAWFLIVCPLLSICCWNKPLKVFFMIWILMLLQSKWPGPNIDDAKYLCSNAHFY